MSYYNRKRNRLKNYDYSTNGAYFVTICTKDKQKILSNIVGDGSNISKTESKIPNNVGDWSVVPKTEGKIPNIVGDGSTVPKAENQITTTVGDGFAVPKPQLTQYGKIVDEYIQKIKEKYNTINVDKYVIMPNHIHMLITIANEKGTANPFPTVSQVIGWLKYNITKTIGQKFLADNIHIFQRSYHDHVIRTQQSYNKIYEYIETNPLRWLDDCFYIP